MGPEDRSNKKKKTQKSILANVSEIVSLKIGRSTPKKLRPFFSLFLKRKPLSSGQTWFLRPLSPLIRGMFVLRSGLRFSFQALEVPEQSVRKRPSLLTKMAFSSFSVQALPVPTRKSKYGSLVKTASCLPNHQKINFPI